MKVVSVIACLLLSLVARDAIGQTFSDNEVFELPTASPWLGKADHVVSAINDRGDIFVTWSASVFQIGHPYAEMRRVEGAFLRRTNDFRWKLYPTVTLGETQPSLMPGGVPIFANGDNCRKPDVVATGNDFIVAWQRLEIGNSPNGYLECARIQVSDIGEPVVNLAHPAGIGFLLDDQVDLRHAGGMVDLAYDHSGHGNQVVAVYASRIAAQPTKSGNVYDFELRAVPFGFQGNQTAPQIKHVQVLVDDVALDDFIRGDPRGGRVLPDAVFDQFGKLVVAYEDFRLAVRTGTADQGHISLRRFEVKRNGTFTELNNQSLVGTNPQLAMRRPNLMRSGDSQVIDLAFGERIIPGQATDVFHYTVQYPDAVSDAVLTDLQSTMTAGIDEDLPVPVQLPYFRAIVICADPPQGKRRVSRQAPGQTDWTDFSEFAGLNPWRPAMAVLADDPNRPGKSLAVLTVEGREEWMPYSRIYCEIITP